MQWFITRHGIRPQLRSSRYDEHEARLHALAARLDRDADTLLNDAIQDLLFDHEAKIFGGLHATQRSPDGDPPLIHARLLSDAIANPLCGATDGP